MKIYVIMQKATEYNDEYDVPQEGGTLWKAFRTREAAESKLDSARVDAVDGKDINFDYTGGSLKDMAYIEEIEVDESQIIPSSEIPAPSIKKPAKTGTYAEAQARAAAARVEAANLAKDAIHQSAKAIFDQYPDLESFTWNQYTPYFNDGDECVFSVDVDYPKVELKGFDVEEGNPVVLYFKDGNSDKVYVVDNDWNSKKVLFSYGRRGSSLVTGTKVESSDYSERKEVEEKLIAEKKREGYGCPYDDIRELLSSIEEDDMKSVFGDHVEITATREGFDVQPYSHD